MLEATMVVGFFLMIILVIVESVIVGYSALTVQYVASRAARFAMASTLPQGTTRTTAIQDFVVSQAGIFGLRVFPSSQVTICAIARDPSCSITDSGGPGDFILIRVAVPAGFFLGRFQFFLYGEALSKNEHFS